MIYLLTAFASAGKLADGFQGVPWGTQEAGLSKPSDACRASAEPGVAWTCDDTIGEVKASINWMYDEPTKQFYGVIIVVDGDFAICSTLLSTLESAWGASTNQNQYLDGRLDAKVWTDGEGFGTFKYNQFSGECQVVAVAQSPYALVEAAKKAKAAKGAGDL